jgi:hypothetical protein
MLCGLITDFGQHRENTPLRAQTGLLFPSSVPPSHAQFLSFTSPRFLHISHSHAAGEEN